MKETTDDDTLRDFFESKRISDGGEVKSLDRKDGVLTVTFTDATGESCYLLLLCNVFTLLTVYDTLGNSTERI